jgi:predicted nucleic-acid-binding Zn-ribbon protein
MQRTKEALEREFVCPKCRQHGAIVSCVQMGRSVAHVLPLPSNRYWAASCGLCGYTELYSLAVAEKCAEAEKDLQGAAKLAEKTE